MGKSIVPVNQIAARSSTGYEFSNSNPSEVVEIEDDPVEVVEKQMENLKFNYQFDEKNVPKTFQDLMKDKMNSLKEIQCYFLNKECTMMFDEIEVRLGKNENSWMLRYKGTEKTVKTDDPEKSIIDHLWFMLKNRNIKLESLKIYAWDYEFPQFFSRGLEANHPQKIDKEKVNTLLQSMFKSIDHQFYINSLGSEGFNEDTLLMMLKNVKPGTAEWIELGISWKQEGNYQKMKEIVETDQWKQAKNIHSTKVSSLKIEDLFQCEVFWLELESITLKDVLGVVKHVFNSAEKKCCSLSSFEQKVDIDPILNFIKSQMDVSEIAKIKPIHSQDEFCFEIVSSGKPVFLSGQEDNITIRNY